MLKIARLGKFGKHTAAFHRLNISKLNVFLENIYLLREIDRGWFSWEGRFATDIVCVFSAI